MAIDSKNLLVWVKAMSRGQALPLDASEIHASLAEAEAYAGTATAYAGQSIKALLDDGKYHEFILQPSDAGYVLEEVGAVKSEDLKQYVQVVEELPETAQEEGVIYIHAEEGIGYVWLGDDWKEVCRDVQPTLEAMQQEIDDLEGEVALKAPIANPVFSGVVKVGEEEVALKSYVEGLFANLEERCATPGVLDAEHDIPAGYKAGDSFRVAEEGTYAGVECELGDLVLCVKDYVEGSASDNDFIVLQANIDGAVTSRADTATIGEIVVFDAVTGKVIKGSGVQIASLNEAIAMAHEHANMAQLETYDKTQTELLAAAKAEAQGLVNAHAEAVEEVLSNKADKATTLAGYGITDAYNKTEIDGKLEVITENLNTKVTAAEVETAITEAREVTLEQAAEAAAEALEERIGGIPADSTLKTYIDTAIGTGGTASAEAIAKAKQEAIEASNEYADEQIANALRVTEF